MALPQANQASFCFLCTTLAPQTFKVTDFNGVDALSSPYRFTIALESAPCNLSARELLGQQASLCIEGHDHTYSYSGIVRTFATLDHTSDSARYSLELVPRLWLLSLTQRSRVFQQMSIPQIIATVLNEAGLGGSFEIDTTPALHPQREQVIQYQESDLAFISRLMERAGIWYFFSEPPHSLDAPLRQPGREQCIITDRPSRFLPALPCSTLPFRPTSGLHEQSDETERESIQRIQRTTHMLPATARVGDYNYRTPEVSLHAASAIDSNGEGEQVVFGVQAGDISQVERAAQLLANRLRSGAEIVEGRSTCRGFRAGCRFTLQHHSTPSINDTYLLSRVEHRGDQFNTARTPSPFTYDNSFGALSSERLPTFAPQLTTQPPKLPGILTAAIESDGGSYAGIDEQGRYKVRLPFDTSDTPSAAASKWIRLAQPTSGSGCGMHFPGLEGSEMVLACIDGDPDKIMGLGMVPNASHPGPVTSANKHHNILRTSSNNELLMDDTQEKQKVILTSAAGRTLHLDDEFERVVLQCSAGSSIVVDDRNKQCIISLGEHTITLSGAEGAQGLQIRSAAGHCIELDDGGQRVRIQSAGGHSVEIDDAAGSIRVADSGADNTIALQGASGMTLESRGALTIRAGTELCLSATTIELDAATTLVHKAGADLSMHGLNIELAATMDMQASAGMNAQLCGSLGAVVDGGTQTQIKGLAVSVCGQVSAELSATVVTTVKGGMVMIN